MAETVGQTGQLNRQWIIETYGAADIKATDASGHAGLTSKVLGRVDEVFPIPSIGAPNSTFLGEGTQQVVAFPKQYHSLGGTIAGTLAPAQFQIAVYQNIAGTLVALTSSTVSSSFSFLERGL